MNLYREAFEKALEPLISEFVREIPLMLLVHKEGKLSHAALVRRGKREHARIQATMLQPAAVKWMRLLRNGVSTLRPDWKALQLQGEATMKGPLLEALLYAGNKAVGRNELRKQELDPMGAEAVNWTDAHGAELVTNVNTEAKTALALFTRQMVQAGLTAQETARAMRALVPLLPQHATAVGTSLTKMLDKGVPWDKAMKRSARYAQKLHNYRTKMIARTESSYAQCEGQRQGYKELGVKKLKRIEDPDCCTEICAVASGRIYTIALARGVLPAHPQCEGTWVAVV